MIPELHPQAEVEAAEAAAWYDDRQAGLGDRFADDLAQALEAVAADPGRYPFVPGVPESLLVRLRPLSRFP